jgi:hypothetical protein
MVFCFEGYTICIKIYRDVYYPLSLSIKFDAIILKMVNQRKDLMGFRIELSDGIDL